MNNELDLIKNEAKKLITEALSTNNLEEIRINYLGKSGRITLEMQKLGQLPKEERKDFGAKVNLVKQEITQILDEKKIFLQAKELEEILQKEQIDVTIPERPYNKGNIHLISKVIDECVAIFEKMGFSSQFGPEIEDDFFNFTALNVPKNHPARQMQDTFYLGDKLLRTHTSSVQIRAMQNNKPPFKFIAHGRVFRSDYDMTHTPMFHQIEAVYVDTIGSVNMGHLKGCLYDFLSEFFAIPNIPIRFRPSFFPFTEPSAEVDIGYEKNGTQVIIGKQDKWLEILGCGMIHPNVLENVGIDSTKYQGFAFGVGVERLAMLKYGAPDLRAFFDSDVRWLNHYGFGL